MDIDGRMEESLKDITQLEVVKFGKYTLIVDINFEIGQFCRFSKIFSN